MLPETSTSERASPRKLPPRVAGPLTAAFLLLASLVFLYARRPPAPLPADAPPDVFSADRAMAHVRAIAALPHPIGTREHTRVRDYVARTLADLGLEVEIQRTTGVTAKYRVAGTVENVVGRLRGSASGHGRGGDAILLAAHYDSVAAGPGAGDDASGVAAILEAMRALQARAEPHLRNDVVVLVSDGEETGLLGASAFMAEHPWAKDVRLAVNFEARGDAGVSSLFETSAGNGVLVREAASAVPGLVGSSLAYEVYKRMPNDTDATVFKAHGLPALNFAFVGHWDAYHTPRDDPDHLDRGSLQQQGNYALGLARRFATVDLGALGAPDAVYFSLPGGFFVHYEHSVGLAFAVLAGLLGAYVTWKALRRRDATPLGLLGGVAFFATSLVVLGGVGFLVASFAEGAHARFLPEGDVLGSAPYVCAAIALAIGMWSALFALARRKISTDDMALGSAAALVALAIVTSVEGVGVAGVAYLLVWPGAGAAAQSLVKRESATGPIMTLLLSVPALAIIVPLLHAVFEGLGMSPPGGALVCILVGLLAASLVRPLETVRAWSPRWVTLAPLVAGVILLAWGMAVTRVSAAHPKASQLLYVVDFDTHTARWATTAERVDAWSSQLVGTSPARDALFPGWRSPCLQGEPREPLAVAAGAPAWLKVVDSTLANGERTVQLVVHPSRDGDLDLETATGVLVATVNGKPVPAQAKAGPWTLRYIGASKDVGVALSLRVKGNAHIPLFITTRTAGVPEEGGRTERPAWSVTRHDGDRTLSRRRIDL